MITVRQLWHNRDRSWLSDSELDETLGKDQLLLKSICSLVSLGTERRMITGSLDEKTAGMMRIPYMEGSFSGSFTYGYSLVGEAFGGPPKDNYRVHVLHPHQDRAVVKHRDAYPLPASLDPEIAALISNMETAITICWDCDPKPGEKIMIIGLGTVGILTTLALQLIFNIRPCVREIDETRLQKVAVNLEVDPCKAESDRFDAVINCSGSEKGLQHGLKALKREGRLIEASWYGTQTVKLPLGEDFHYKRLRIISSQVSHIPERMAAKWDHRSRKELACQLLTKTGPHWMIDQEVKFKNAPEFFTKLRKGEVNSIATLIRY